MRARKQTTPTATQTAAEHEQATNPITRRRKTAVWLLIVVSTVVLLIGAVTIWVKREVLDTNNFTASTTELMRNPKVQSATGGVPGRPDLRERRRPGGSAKAVAEEPEGARGPGRSGTERLRHPGGDPPARHGCRDQPRAGGDPTRALGVPAHRRRQARRRAEGVSAAPAGRAPARRPTGPGGPGSREAAARRGPVRRPRQHERDDQHRAAEREAPACTVALPPAGRGGSVRGRDLACARLAARGDPPLRRRGVDRGAAPVRDPPCPAGRAARRSASASARPGRQ